MLLFDIVFFLAEMLRRRRTLTSKIAVSVKRIAAPVTPMDSAGSTSTRVKRIAVAHLTRFTHSTIRMRMQRLHNLLILVTTAP